MQATEYYLYKMYDSMIEYEALNILNICKIYIRWTTINIIYTPQFPKKQLGELFFSFSYLLLYYTLLYSVQKSRM